MADHILAIDQGTTSTRAILFDQDLKIVRVAQQVAFGFQHKAGRLKLAANNGRINPMERFNTFARCHASRRNAVDHAYGATGLQGFKYACQEHLWRLANESELVTFKIDVMEDQAEHYEIEARRWIVDFLHAADIRPAIRVARDDRRP